MRKSKKFLSLMLAAVMAASLVGCGKSSDTKTSSAAKSGSAADSATSTASTTSTAKSGSAASTDEEAVEATITVWSPQEDQAKESGNWLGTMCDKFAAAHPNWKLTFKYGVCPEGEAKTQVTQDPSAAADVYMLANDNIGDLVAAKAISKLGGTALDAVKSQNTDLIVNTVTYEGGVYAVPFTSNTWFMYYDKRVFSEDDVKSLDKMLEKGKVSFPLSNSWYNVAFYAGNGCTLFGGNNDASAGIDYSGEKAVAATKYLVNLVKNKNFSNDADGSGIKGLKNGSVNAVFSGTWDYNNVADALGAENVGIVQLPTAKIDGKEVQLKSFAGSKAIGVNPNTKYPQVAVALASFLGSPEAQKEHYKTRNTIPTDKSLLEDPEIAADALATAQGNTIANTSIMQPFVAGMSNYWSNAENMGKAILSGDVTEKNAAEKTEALNTAFNTK